MFNIEDKQPKDGEICYVKHNGEYYVIEDVQGNAYRAPMQFDVEKAYKLSRQNGTFTEEEFPNVTSLKLIRV